VVEQLDEQALELGGGGPAAPPEGRSDRDGVAGVERLAQPAPERGRAHVRHHGIDDGGDAAGGVVEAADPHDDGIGLREHVELDVTVLGHRAGGLADRVPGAGDDGDLHRPPQPLGELPSRDVGVQVGVVG
jgi:hypothetical protein